jgi:hypothetical protein
LWHASDWKCNCNFAVVHGDLYRQGYVAGLAEAKTESTTQAAEAYAQGKADGRVEAQVEFVHRFDVDATGRIAQIGPSAEKRIRDSLFLEAKPGAKRKTLALDSGVQGPRPTRDTVEGMRDADHNNPRYLYQNADGHFKKIWPSYAKLFKLVVNEVLLRQACNAMTNKDHPFMVANMWSDGGGKEWQVFNQDVWVSSAPRWLTDGTSSEKEDTRLTSLDDVHLETATSKCTWP